MPDTIEHNAYIFWDNNGCFPGDSAGDAFERAGAHVQYIDTFEIVVRGLDLRDAKNIGRISQADYMGPVIEKLIPLPKILKDITPATENAEAAAATLPAPRHVP